MIKITSMPVAKAPKNFPSACATVVPAGWEPAASALLCLCSWQGMTVALAAVEPLRQGHSPAGSEHHWAAAESSFIPEVEWKAS